jgi:hypothetical protein
MSSCHHGRHLQTNGRRNNITLDHSVATVQN